MELYPLFVAEFVRIRVFATAEEPNSDEFGYKQQSFSELT